MAPQPVLQPSPSPLPSATSLHLLPFSLSFDGPAPIDRFFHPRPYPSDAVSTSTPKPHRQAAFRGRRVVSSLLAVPTGYKGVVLASSAPALPSSSSNRVEEAEEDAQQQQEREERAAKRAKRAAESAAALGAAGGEGEGSGSRRSPRKSVAEAARRRAVEAARKRGKAAKGKGKFSLDEEDEEEEERVEEVLQQQEEVKVEEELVKKEAPAGEEAMQVDVEVETTIPSALEVTDTSATISAVAVEETTVEATLEETRAEAASPAPAPPPAPLLSRTSTTTSSAIPSTPLTATPSIDSLPAGAELKNPFDASLSLPSAAAAVEPTETLQRDRQVLRPVLAFSAIEVWNADFPVAGGRVAEEDDVGRAVSEWLGVAEKIHAY
ncbi:hypothetical protein JCM6882_004394 [Rhodosporidiobolus microsporus]